MTGTGTELDVNAKRSDDGKALVLLAVNWDDKEAVALHKLSGFAPTKPTAHLTELSGPLDAVNTADNLDAIVPGQTEWQHGLKNQPTNYTFPPHSITVIRFD